VPPVPDERYPPLCVIYQQVEGLAATKHRGPFAIGEIGKGFIHEFTTPAAALGVGAGAVLICNNGEAVALPKRCVILVGTQHLFGIRTYRR